MTLGLLDGRPLPRAVLDRRLAALRTGPRSTALPQPGSPEDRQLTRWVAQVLLTEALCEAVAAERGLPVPSRGPARLDQQAAVELGSITAAAYEGSAAVRAVYEAVTADVEPSPADIAHYRSLTDRPPATRWHVALPDGGFEADPDTLPADLADALRAAPPGEWVTVGPWKAVLLATLTVPRNHDPAPVLRDAARRAAFVRWLDRERARRLTLVEGLEHPGDPAQPDNHHRH
jgi:[acyl-carrier-protein] S-malonyltransferase